MSARSSGKASKRGSEMLGALETLVVSVVRERLARCGLPAGRIDDLAMQTGRAAAEMVRRDSGGGQIYVPLDAARRNAEIYKAFTGDNHFELARRYHTTVNSVYRIIRQERARRSVKQLSLMEALCG
jgi:Mor family transcriptional regulator